MTMPVTRAELRAEIDRLKADLDDLKTMLDGNEGRFKKLCEERDRLKALGEATLKELREFFPTVQGDLITRWEAALHGSQGQSTNEKTTGLPPGAGQCGHCGSRGHTSTMCLYSD
jgi:hypothetical protein